ncbi:MAG TPA: translation initiation factor IF-3 [Arenicellales bacterium]|nr:translation initiation factor IF-3 [Arenicellales bacterium]
MAVAKQQRLNEDIVDAQIRLVGDSGEQLGIVTAIEARGIAVERGMDLVEIAPNAEPPVCRLMDYGKFLYSKSKKKQESKKKQKQITVKEIKFRPGTDIGDYDIKVRNLTRFLEAGNKVKVTLRFRGREMAHQELGMEMLKRVEDALQDIGVVEQMPKMEGRQMVMVLAPAKN